MGRDDDGHTWKHLVDAGERYVCVGGWHDGPGVVVVGAGEASAGEGTAGWNHNIARIHSSYRCEYDAGLHIKASTRQSQLREITSMGRAHSHATDWNRIIGANLRARKSRFCWARDGLN